MEEILMINKDIEYIDQTENDIDLYEAIDHLDNLCQTEAYFIACEGWEFDKIDTIYSRFEEIKEKHEFDNEKLTKDELSYILDYNNDNDKNIDQALDNISDFYETAGMSYDYCVEDEFDTITEFIDKLEYLFMRVNE